MTYEIISERKLRDPLPCKLPDDVYRVVKRYAKARREQFILITLDAEHKPISITIVSVGIVNRTIVHPREVFIRAIRDVASAIIVCHNHPSGELYPSQDDLNLTARLMEAGEVLGIPILDHLIIGKPGFLSLRGMGYLTELKTNGEAEAVPDKEENEP